MAQSSSNLSTLSPRDQFRDTVRKLGTEDVHGHKRNKSISLQYNPYELHHVSSLRVSPLRKSPYKAGPTSLRQVVEEADFGAEERDIWSRGSPTGKSHNNRDSQFVLHEDASAPPSHNRGQANDFPPLRPHTADGNEADERPKTRRGPSGPSAFKILAGTEHESDDERSTRSSRLAKFLEGTMTSRSGATASTWSESDYASSSSEAEETDSDVTPKAGRSRRSDSFDLRDFQPPTLTPSGIKRTLFGRRDGTKEKKDKKTEKDVKKNESNEADEKKPKRRLRKSMSKLQFLGEKMKIFGSSSQDLPQQVNAHAVQEQESILNERKRKAEAAYIEQFGLKKQRDNAGLANVSNSPDMADLQDFGGNQKYDSSTVRCRSSTARSRRISTGSMQTIADLSGKNKVNEHDIRKRPSRRELEKENQELRALLRESHANKEQETIQASEDEPIPPIPPLRIRRKSTASCHTFDEVDDKLVLGQNGAEPPVPPLPPQHPDRRVLGNVSNGRSRRVRRESFGIASDADLTKGGAVVNPLQDVPVLAPPTHDKKGTMAPRRSMSAIPRSVSTIIEETGDEIEHRKRSLRSRTIAAGKENAKLIPAINAVNAKKEEWQWPDDVF